MKFISLLEKALNRYLRLDPESQDRLGKLLHKTVVVQLLGFSFATNCHASVLLADIQERSSGCQLKARWHDNSSHDKVSSYGFSEGSRALNLILFFDKNQDEYFVRITTEEDDEKVISQAVIQGTPLSLLHVALTKENRQKFFAEDVKIQGDAELAQQVIQLFDHMEIDWEEYLSRCIGDFPAYHIGNIVRKIKKFNKRAEETILQNVNEYLHEEKEFVPTREALQDFFHDVDAIRMDTDRLEERILRLQQKIHKGTL